MDRLNEILYKAKQHKRRNWLLSKVILENALQDFPNEKLLYIELGDLLASKKIYKEAIKYYTKALNLNPDDNLYHKIGTTFLSLDEFALAINYYEKVKEKTPEILYNLAYSYSRLNKHQKSIDILKELIDKENSNEIPYLLLAEIYYYLRLYNKAISILDEAEKKFGAKATIHYLKANVYKELQLWLLSVHHFTKTEKINSDFPNFYRNFAISLEKLGNIDKAITMLKKNLENYPDDPSTYFYLIKFLIEKEDYIQAKKYLSIAKAKEKLLDKIYLSAFELSLKSISEKKD